MVPRPGSASSNRPSSSGSERPAHVPTPPAGRPPSKENPKAKQSRKEGLLGVKLVYDPAIAVVDQFREQLAKSKTRLMDLFREMDQDNDGYISKKDWRKAFSLMGPDFPKDVVDQTFTQFDPDGSGEVEYKELEAFVKRGKDPNTAVQSKGAQKNWGKTLKGAAKDPGSSSSTPKQSEEISPRSVKWGKAMKGIGAMASSQ